MGDDSQTTPRRLQPLPDVSQTTPRRLPDESQTTPRRLPDDSQTTPRRLPDDSQTTPTRHLKNSHFFKHWSRARVLRQNDLSDFFIFTADTVNRESRLTVSAAKMTFPKLSLFQNPLEISIWILDSRRSQ